jgi:putative DNA primase/helicase
MNSSGTGKAALEYLAQGLSVIPLLPCKKVPAIPWEKYQTAAPTSEEVENWFTEDPSRNLGIVTGMASRVIVLDVDGPDGAAELAKLGDLPETPMVSTGKGKHYYFAHPGGDVRNFARKRPGLDLRADGGQVVAPPSVHPSGAVYTWQVPLSVGLAYPPAWLIGLIRGEKNAPAINGNGNGREPSDWYARAALGNELDTLAKSTEGQRNDQLNRSAFALGQLVGTGLLAQYPTEDELLRVALAIGLGEREALRTIESGMQDGMKQPREIPDRPMQMSTRSGRAAAPSPVATEEPEPPPVTGEHLSDLGNGCRLVRLYGHDLRYVEVWGWLSWSGKHWEIDQTRLPERMAKQIPGALYAQATTWLEQARDATEEARATQKAGDMAANEAALKRSRDLQKQANQYAAWARNSEARSRIDNMVKLAQSELAVIRKTDQFDADPWAFNCTNGTLDLRTGELHAHRRADLLMKLAAVSFDATARCPRWLAFLEQIMAGDQDLIRFLQKFVGYTLAGDTSEQCLVFEYGSGANGKSTFTETIAAMLGNYARRTPVETLLERFRDQASTDLAALAGARMVIASEIPLGRRLNEGLVKDMTGGDTISARFLYRDSFTFQPCFKLWMYGNHKPKILGTDDGIWRRMRLVPFTITIPPEKQDLKLRQKLLDELPGILAWAVEGCLAWQREGLGLPAAVREATASYRAESDVLAAFLEECTVTETTASVQVGELKRVYDEWCKTNGERTTQSSNALGRALTERGFDRFRKGSLTYYLGLGLTIPEGGTRDRAI